LYHDDAWEDDHDLGYRTLIFILLPVFTLTFRNPYVTRIVGLGVREALGKGGGAVGAERGPGQGGGGDGEGEKALWKARSFLLCLHLSDLGQGPVSLRIESLLPLVQFILFKELIYLLAL
jgi:hypothetical protein